MKLLAALALAAASTCTPAQSPPSNPAPAPSEPVDASAPPPDGSAPDPISLRLCLMNFEQLNPGLPEAQVEEIFCATPEALAPWTRQAVINPNAIRANDAGAH